MTMVINDFSHIRRRSMTTYDPSLSMTLRAARDQYFAVNGFGDDGGYAAPWVDFKLGPIPMPFPNTAGRVRAVRYHDLHHVLTGYATDTRSEFEISAWELGAGCKNFWAAWQLNLSGLSAGMLSIPRRTFRAFVRGRHATSLYGREFEPLLDRTVGEMRAECGLDRPAAARASDVALFALAWAVAAVSGLVALPIFVGFALVFFVAGRLRRAPRAEVRAPARA
jgi:hypothetical protein